MRFSMIIPYFHNPQIFEIESERGIPSDFNSYEDSEYVENLNFASISKFV